MESGNEVSTAVLIEPESVEAPQSLYEVIERKGFIIDEPMTFQKLEEKATKAQEALEKEEKLRKELEALNSKLLAEKTALLDSLSGEKGALQDYQEKAAKLTAQKNDLDNQLRVSWHFIRSAKSLKISGAIKTNFKNRDSSVWNVLPEIHARLFGLQNPQAGTSPSRVFSCLPMMMRNLIWRMRYLFYLLSFQSSSRTFIIPPSILKHFLFLSRSKVIFRSLRAAMMMKWD